MLEVRNLTKRYGSNTAVSDLSFTVGSGGIYGLLGPNGAGKSTTMNIITGYLAATDGSVEIDGHDILKDPIEAKKRIGYLPEVPPLYPDLTVWEYLMFVSELKGVKGKKRSDTVKEIIDRTGLFDVKDRLIGNLSKGYRQRAGIAGALINYPGLIILDEPTAGLDPAQIIEIRELILSLKDDHAVILSSHILQEISAVCDHIMVISHGRLMADGTPDDIMKSMNMENRTELLMRADKERLSKAFAEIHGVTGIDAIDAGNGLIRAEVKGSPEMDLREDIFNTAVKCGFTILDMHSERMSLEDVYMFLTSDEYAASLQKEAGAENTETKQEEAGAENAKTKREEAGAENPETKREEAGAENAETKREEAGAENPDPGEEGAAENHEDTDTAFGKEEE